MKHFGSNSHPYKRKRCKQASSKKLFKLLHTTHLIEYVYCWCFFPMFSSRLLNNSRRETKESKHQNLRRLNPLTNAQSDAWKNIYFLHRRRSKSEKPKVIPCAGRFVQHSSLIIDHIPYGFKQKINNSITTSNKTHRNNETPQHTGNLKSEKPKVAPFAGSCCFYILPYCE
jgi:hypothetical protein